MHSMLGLVTLAVPQPTIVTYTSTTAVNITGFRSTTLTRPLITTPEFPVDCDYAGCYSNAAITETIMATTTWTNLSKFSNDVTWYFTETASTSYGLSHYMLTTLSELGFATPFTVTAGPIVSTSVTTSTFTSSLTQTGYTTKQLSTLRTNSTNQTIAAALAPVLVVSLLTVCGLRRKQSKRIASTSMVSGVTAWCVHIQQPWPEPNGVGP